MYAQYVKNTMEPLNMADVTKDQRFPWTVSTLDRKVNWHRVIPLWDAHASGISQSSNSFRHSLPPFCAMICPFSQSCFKLILFDISSLHFFLKEWKSTILKLSNQESTVHSNKEWEERQSDRYVCVFFIYLILYNLNYQS